MALYDNLEIAFYDAAGIIQSIDGKGINFGEKVEWKISPFSQKQKDSASMDSLAYFWLCLVCFAVIVSFILAIMKGSLVSTWMLINSLQLMAHIPLVSDSLPQNALYFLQNFLSVTKLSNTGMNFSFDQLDMKF